MWGCGLWANDQSPLIVAVQFVAVQFVSKHVFFLFIAVTGSCFFIFSSALKASAGYLAKSSIVEGKLSARGESGSGREFIIYSNFSKVVHVSTPASNLLYSECVDVSMCVSVYILTDCVSRRVSVLLHVSV